MYAICAILILGGGVLGQFLTQILCNMGHEVSVVEVRKDLYDICLKNGVKEVFELEVCRVTRGCVLQSEL